MRGLKPNDTSCFPFRSTILETKPPPVSFDHVKFVLRKQFNYLMIFQNGLGDFNNKKRNMNPVVSLKCVSLPNQLAGDGSKINKATYC